MGFNGIQWDSMGFNGIQWEKPDFRLKNPDLLFRNPGFLLKNVDFIIKQDSGLHNVSAALTSEGMWENTLLVFSADNGGVGSLGNNPPLRGHKHDPWEGGVRATAFMTGGVIPKALRGTNSGNKLVHISGAYTHAILTAN